ncbi:MAG: LysR family transcriptional regulator [Solirubrobacteraceae bacterium]|nr:LysR family transcriptional regulator [Solirubrobacteraceae bacterium]
MDLTPLRCFAAVAEHGSVHAAAQDLHLSQASVSRHVQRLERELGAELFTRRDGRALELTDAGRRVLADAHELLDDAQRRWASLRELARGDAPRVTVGVGTLASLSEWFGALMHDFRAAHPDVRLATVESYDFAATQRGIARGEVDVGVNGVAVGAPPPELEVRPFAPLEPRLVVAPGHRLARRGRIALEDVAGAPFAFLDGSESMQRFEAACAAAGVEPNVVQRCDQVLTLAHLVGSGDVVTAVYAAGRHDLPGPPGHALVMIDLDLPGPVFELAVMWARGRRLDPAAQAFADHAVAVLCEGGTAAFQN